MTTPTLPPLPEPVGAVMPEDGSEYLDCYTADQMHAYAVAAVAAAHPQPAPQPLTDERIEEGAADAGYNAYKLTAFYEGARFAEQAHGIVPAPTTDQSHPQRCHT